MTSEMQKGVVWVTSCVTYCGRTRRVSVGSKTSLVDYRTVVDLISLRLISPRRDDDDDLGFHLEGILMVCLPCDPGRRSFFQSWINEFSVQRAGHHRRILLQSTAGPVPYSSIGASHCDTVLFCFHILDGWFLYYGWH
jgi:hypothetical protein